jgi:hypothetical protein
MGGGMSKLTMSVITLVIVNIFAWLQLNGQFLKNGPDWLKSKVFVFAMGAPIGMALWYATKWSYEYYGFTWNIRLIGFGLGTLVFGVMSWSILDEIPTLKTIICLMLAASIVLIQITNVIGK